MNLDRAWARRPCLTRHAPSQMLKSFAFFACLMPHPRAAGRPAPCSFATVTWMPRVSPSEGPLAMTPWTTVPAFVLGITFAAGTASLVNHHTALKRTEAARVALEQSDREKGQRLLADTAEIDRLSAELIALEEKAGAAEATRTELAELRKEKEETDARSALLDDFVKKFKSMIDAGHLSIDVMRGRIVLALQSEVLFDTAKAEITPEGRATLAEIARTLKTVRGRKFQVAGHTDTLPIHSAEFPSNWELSSARAVEVVKWLVAEGVPPAMLSATGYGEFEPAAKNTRSAQRAKNRRIEITLEPNIASLAAIPQLKM